MKKRILSVTFVALILMSLTSCLGDGGTTTPVTVSATYTTPTTAVSETYAVPEATATEEENSVAADVIKEILQSEEDHYIEYYELAVATMLDTLVVAEEMCNLEVLVWGNAIWQVESEETDAYTKDENGYFYESFDDALANLYASEEYQSLEDDLWTYQYEVELYLDEVRIPPDGIDDTMHEALVDYYVEYQDFINLALNTSSESYNTFTEKFDELEETSIDAYNRADFYISSW